MGKPNHANHDYLAQARSAPGEVKHLSNQRKINRIDTVSSGERKRQSLNFRGSLAFTTLLPITYRYEYTNKTQKYLYICNKFVIRRRSDER